ncbi:MAG: B12-binding domain-containing radical SAM protein [Deltaproteobacteria bacterium]|nr:B12-binding domain-containing radical SAM protein [Deltaproteobacteria bacterium]
MEGWIRSQSDQTRKRRRLRIIIPAYPAFNIYSRVARLTTALGPVSVATSVHDMEGWDVEVIDENNYRRAGPKDDAGMPDHATLQKLRPADVVGFYGGLTSTIPRLYELARFYRKRGIMRIAGGQHFIEENITEALQSGVDVVVIGEGEETIKELLLACEGRRPQSEIAGIAYLDKDQLIQTRERAPLSDFDRLPIPDFSLVRYAKIKIYPVGRVRGCGMDCEFCTVKGKARYASGERLMEQISSLFETRGAKRFFIVDDLFGQDRLETLRLCQLLQDYQKMVKKRFKITVQIRLDKAKDAELLRTMREAGINQVAIGFESPIGEELKAMDKRLKPEDMVSLSRLFHKAGFLVHGMFIFGYPLTEGANFRMPAKERIGRLREFIKRARVDTVQVLLPVPLPGTELTHRLKQQNRIYSKDYLGWEYYDGNFPLFVPDEPMTPEEMQASIRLIMGRFYRFKHMFQIGFNILSFPLLFFYLHNLRRGWRKWYRIWTNSVTRFGGWLILRRWFSEFKKDSFSSKLAEAKKMLAHS